MKKIQLRNNKGFVLVDDADFPALSKYKWFISKNNHTSYAATNIKRSGKYTKVLMHRLIMGEPKGKEVDHRDGDGLINQRFNLRICTRSQNAMNQQKTRGVSQYKGVCWSKKSKKWAAYIRKEGKQRHLGFSESEIECAELYDTAAKEMFGEFARPNFTVQADYNEQESV